MNTSSYFRLRHRRSMKMLSRYLPLPSMLNPNTAGRQLVNEIAAGELHTLIGVEYVRLAVAIQRFLQCLHAERHVQPDRQSPCQNTPAEPVHYRNQIDKTLRQRNIRDVSAPPQPGWAGQ